jgi:hypothetical protein
MAFMRPEITGKQDWAGVETTAGFWWVPFDVLSKSEAESVRRGDFEPLVKYTEGGRVSSSMSSVKKGYGVRLSAPGYMDATDWEVYSSKAEALRRGRELAREAEGEDYATKKRSFAHARKKSPAQLDREIAEVVGARPINKRKRVRHFSEWKDKTGAAHLAVVYEDRSSHAITPEELLRYRQREAAAR